MASKPRVHEVAAECGVDSTVAIAKLRELGEMVRSPSSTLEPPVARRLRAVLQSEAEANSDTEFRTRVPAAPQADRGTANPESRSSRQRVRIAKPRVHEVASEVGVDARIALAKLKELGEFVKSPSSTLEPPVARKLKAALEADRINSQPVRPPNAHESMDQPSSQLEDAAAVAAHSSKSPLSTPSRATSFGPQGSSDATSEPREAADAVRTLAARPQQSEDASEDLIVGRYRRDQTAKARQGGQASVYRCTDTVTGDTVAVKFVEGLFTDEIALRIFKREVAALRGLRHQGIVRYRDSGQDDGGRPFIVLDWVDGSFDQLLAERYPLAWDEALGRYVLPVARALAYMHLQQVEHRDLKPGNILLDADGRPVVADFGVGKSLAGPDVTEHTIQNFRSGVWAPPEHDGPRYTRDVYSLAVLYVRCVSPNTVTEFHQLEQAIDHLVVPDALKELLHRMADVDPLRRPNNAAVVVDELESMISRGAKPRQVLSVSLKLTKRVREKVGGAFGTPEQIRRIMSTDLKEDAHIGRHLGRQPQETDDLTFVLHGEATSYLLRVGDGGFDFVVVDVFRQDDEHLNRARERSLLLGKNVAWTFEPAGAGAGAELVERIVAFEAKNAAADPSSDPVSPEALDRWRRLLAAREDLERGERRPLPYSELEMIPGGARFSIDAPDDADLLGTEWQVRAGKSARMLARGEVINASSSKVELRWLTNLRSALPPRGNLEPHLGRSYVSLQRQSDALSALERGTVVSSAVGGAILSPEAATPPRPVDVPAWKLELDDDKRAAILGALGGAECVLLKGPPGTGKTRFIAELVMQELAVNSQSRILVVSQTNNAVDNALERVASSGVASVVRLGRQDDDRIARDVRPLLLNRQLSKWATKVRDRAVAHLNDEVAAAGVAPAHLRALLVLEELKLQLLRKAQFEARDAEAADDQTTIATELDLAGADVPVSERAESTRRAIDDLQRQASSLLDGLFTLNESQSIDDVQALIDLIAEQSSATGDLLTLIRLQGEWLDRIGSDAALEAEYLRSVSVVGGTCIGFIGQRAVRDVEFDLCIIDEASRATSTEALVPAVRARRLVVVGDLNQLPPMDEDLLASEVILETHRLTTADVEETLFRRLAERLPLSNQFELSQQRRMIAPIGDLISHCFYDGLLDSPNHEGLPGYELLGRPVTWLDTSTARNRHEDSGTADSGQYVNRLEADLVAARLRSIDDAVAHGVIKKPNGDRKLETLVLAPYRSQVDHLRRRLAREEHAHLSLNVETIDAVQGRESDLTILSVTRNNSQGRMGFLGNAYWRRINVALSRARYGLTIVGDFRFCARGGLSRVVAYIEQHPDTCEVRSSSG